MNLSQIFDKTQNDILESAQLIKIDVHKEVRKIVVLAEFAAIADYETLRTAEQSIKASYNLRDVDIHPKYDPTLFNADVLSCLVPYMNTPQLTAILSDAKVEYEDGTLIINSNMIELPDDDIKEEIPGVVKAQFDLDIAVTINYVKSDDEIMEEFESNKQEIEQKADLARAEERKTVSDIIYGSAIKGNTTPVSEVDEISGRVVVEGTLFAKEIKTRETRDGKYIVLFDITDNKSSVTCKLFISDKNIYKNIESRLKKGVSVRVKGDAMYDKYAHEVVIAANDITEIQVESRMDTADVKRVELHLHTQMSSMDSIVNIKEVLATAGRWGHKAIAITDHGVVQAFPDAMDNKPKGLKILYGVEAYLVNIGRPIVFGANGQTLANTTVVFDIETTGFDKVNDKITEIGAVKIVDGVITERFSTFVNPEIPIPEKITQITGITDDMVRDCKSIEEILPEFTDFCGDAVLVAHNAAFDMGFIKEAAKEPIAQSYIDTVELARALMPELSAHKLNVVAPALGISLEGHHRAVNDAEATAQVYIEFIRRLNEMNVTVIDEINTAFDDVKDPKQKSYHHAIIFAKNYTGLKNLYKIISASHIQYFHKKPRVSKDLFFKYHDGLILGSACEQGELFRAIMHGKSQKEIASIVRLYDFLEIQPLGNNEFLLKSDKEPSINSKDDLIRINKEIIRLGDYFNKPVVATCDVHFVKPEDSQFRAVLYAGQGYTDADSQAPLYYRTTDEMLAEFSYLTKEKAYEIVVENTNKIADMCDEMQPVPSGVYPPVWENAAEEIKEMSEAKAKRIYGEELPEKVLARMEHELGSIIKYGFSVMYLIAQRLVTKSNNDGYLVGSRGSVGSSFVAFLCDITEVNALPPHYVCPNCKNSEFVADGSVECGADMPDKSCSVCGTPLKKDGYDIPFETFLGFEGDKEPDIDLNFSGEYQATAHKYTEELFGEGHVFRAGTISTLADKTAFGFVKKYLEERGKSDSSGAEINRLVSGCAGVKRTTGQHPGGVMILPQGHDIHEFCPIQHPSDDSTKNIVTTHFDYHSISGRLLKLDILGHDDPTMIKMLEDLTGVDAKTIPLDDPKTMSLFTGTQALGVSPADIGSDVGTFGVPEFGTKFVRGMLLDTKPTTFGELVRISGLSHGTDVWLGNAQELIKSDIATLKEAICTRDDIMVYLMYKGVPKKSAFDIMERVRKGKGLTDGDVAVMTENNVPQWYINSCNAIKYMFPKAHAVAYVTMAFRIAWFKVYYPEAFYIAHLTVRADEFDAGFMSDSTSIAKERAALEAKGKDVNAREKSVLAALEIVSEMFARGIKFLPINIYESDASKFLKKDGGILLPLNAFAGLGINAAESIVTARKEEKFDSIEDLQNRTKVSKTIIELMKTYGCLDGMPDSSQLSFF